MASFNQTQPKAILVKEIQLFWIKGQWLFSKGSLLISEMVNI